jgi:hypothetical protein
MSGLLGVNGAVRLDQYLAWPAESRIFEGKVLAI